MKKVFVLLMFVLPMAMASRHALAQEVTITLSPGWNWVSYPRADTLTIAEGLVSFTPTTGDVIKSQTGYVSYLEGFGWYGSFSHFIPGKGLMYKSMNPNTRSFVFGSGGSNGLPTVTTTAVTFVGGNLISGGNVVNSGSSPVTARGICYGPYPYPDLSSTFIHTENGTGNGYYTSVIDASMTGTLYVRAYATNANGTAYGDQVTVSDIDYLRLPRFVLNGVTYVVAPDPQPDYSEYLSHTTANTYCNNLTAYGYSDWRMPTQEELEMMYQYRTSIGGFVQGSTVVNGWTHYVLYYCNPNYYSGAVQWWDGTYTWATYTESGYYCYTNEHKYYRCHIRPIRVEPVVPAVTTNNVTYVSQTSAVCGGNVTNEGGLSVTERGVCLSTSPNPTTYNSHYSNGSVGTGNYTISITDLSPGTQYYVRAYASNSVGTAYGNEVVFTTTCAPTVMTNSVTNITPNSATCGGNVTNEGSGPVTARGICWSTSHNPTISNNHTNDGAGTGSFTSSMTGLTQGTQYYVRAYATNSEGTSYGSEVSFTTTNWLMVTTNNVTYITQTSATCGGYVIVYNGATMTARGVCWSTTNQEPTTSDSHTMDGTGSGSFTSNLTGLTQNTTYYVRAYATTSSGTVYGETKQFTTTKLSYRISEGGVVATSAGGYFYDSGGPNNNYGNNEHYIMTFTSNQGAGTKIKMTFTDFYTEDDGDYLVIYNGMNTSAPVIGTYTGSSSPGTVIATNPDGALTFVWISDNYSLIYGSGWQAAISIVP